MVCDTNVCNFRASDVMHSLSKSADTTATPFKFSKPISITERAFERPMPPMATTGNLDAKHTDLRPSKPIVELFGFVLVEYTPPLPM